MQVEVIRPYGFCHGVKRATEIAFDLREKEKNRPIVILGQLVHNDNVAQALKEKHIETILVDEEIENKLKQYPLDTLVFFTAHGHLKKYDEILDNLHLESIDAICPSVKLNNERIKNSLNTKKDIAYIGKSHHPETEAALDIDERIILFDVKTKEFIQRIKFPSYHQAIIFSQTTLSEKHYLDAIQMIKKKYRSIDIAPRACFEMYRREEAVKNIDPLTELIYIVGSKHSSNANELYQTACEFHNGINVEMISCKDDINKKTIENVSRVAIVSSASTPDKVIEDIQNYLESL